MPFNADQWEERAIEAARVAAVNGYGISGYRDGGESYSVNLTRHGAVVASGHNDGRGGCIVWMWKGSDERHAARVVAERAMPGEIEPLDSIVCAMIDGGAL